MAKPVSEMRHVKEISEPSPGYIYVDREEETVRLENRFEFDASLSFDEIEESLRKQDAEVGVKQENQFNVYGEHTNFYFYRKDGRVEVHSKEPDLTHLGFVYLEAQ